MRFATMSRTYALRWFLVILNLLMLLVCFVSIVEGQDCSDIAGQTAIFGTNCNYVCVQRLADCQIVIVQCSPAQQALIAWARGIERCVEPPDRPHPEPLRLALRKVRIRL